MVVKRDLVRTTMNWFRYYNIYCMVSSIINIVYFVSQQKGWSKMSAENIFHEEGACRCGRVVRKERVHFIRDTFSRHDEPKQFSTSKCGTWCNLQTHTHNKHQLFYSLINLNLPLRRTETKHCLCIQHRGRHCCYWLYRLASPTNRRKPIWS
jgi:hypothetical protein